MIGNKKIISQWIASQNDDAILYEIKVYKEKRSLSQNAYMWKLISEIADLLRESKDEIYLNILRAYGQSEIISVREDINIKGYFKYYDEIGTGIVNGKRFKHFKIYKGSSEYDSREMAILIEGVIQECKQLEIETLTPKEIAEMRII